MKKLTLKKYPKRKHEVPVTTQMLFKVRDELKADTRALDAKLSGQINSVEGRLTSEIHKLGLLIEEQNARNIFVLDGLESLFNRQERIEDKIG